MKTLLVVLLAAAALLVGFLAYWNTRPDPGSAPEIHAQESPPVPARSPADLESAEPVRSLESSPSTRSEAEVAPALEPRLESDMADRSFAKKYAGVSAADRAAAREAILTRVASNVLTAEELVAAGRELDWLAAHENP
jgi:hypothetical protein